MSVIVTDAGFAQDDWTQGFEGANVLDLASDTDPASLADQLGGVDLKSLLNMMYFLVYRAG